MDSTRSYYYKEKKLYGDSLTFSYYSFSNKLRHSEESLGKKNEIHVKYYYENGNLMSEGNMLYGPKGKMTSYHVNGIKKSELFFKDFDWNFPNPLNNLEIISYSDSIGNAIIKEGEGYCVCELEPLSFDGLIEEGKVTNRVKDGMWKGISKKMGFRFEETYENGRFIRGVLFNKDGRSNEYLNFEETAKPEKGIAHFYNEIGKSMKYPKEARRNRIQGKVFVQFVIDKDGSIIESKVIKGIGWGCDEVALEAIKSSPKWIPGNQRGRPVKQRYTLPLIFKLG